MQLLASCLVNTDSKKLPLLDWHGVVRHAAEWVCAEPDERVGVDYRIVYLVLPRSDAVNTAGVIAVLDEFEYYVKAHNVIVKLILEDMDDTDFYTNVCAVRGVQLGFLYPYVYERYF